MQNDRIGKSSALIRNGIGLTAALLIGGCMFGQYHPTEKFTLETSSRPAAAQLRVGEFRNNSGAGRRMQIVEADGRVRELQFASWNDDPGALISGALNRGFSRAGQPTVRRVSGELDCFGANDATKVFRLAGIFRIDDAPPVRFDLVEPLADGATDPVAIADAARLAANRLAELIAKAGAAKP